MFFLFLTVLFYLFMYNNRAILKYFDYKFYDFTSIILKKSPENKKSNCVIVDIDEKSLSILGQWPWARIITAKLLDNIKEYSPASIGVNIIFPDKDRTSPDSIENFYKDFFSKKVSLTGIPSYMRDNDKILAYSLKRSEAVLSVYLYDEKYQASKRCENLFYEKRGKFPIFVKNPIKKSFVFCNYPVLQKNSENFGFINIKVDEDGIFRRMPLFMLYKQKPILSFPLALLSVLDKAESERLNEVSILGHRIKTNDKAEVLLNFNSPEPKIFSAVDILNKEVNREELIGKIVIISSSAIGLNRSYINGFQEKISGMKIYTTFIDNVLSDSLYVQPEIFKDLNLLGAFLLSLVILFLLFGKRYISIFFLFLAPVTFGLIFLINMFYSYKIYISVGYFLVPFSVYFFGISLFFGLINHKEKRYFNDELAKSHSAALESITLVAAMRDDETGAHLIRTKNYIKLLANHLYKKGLYKKYLNPKFINLLYEAAPLHDIGKVGIPDHILKKRGRFTKEEYEIMKKHTVLGKEMIEKAMKNYNRNEFLQIACSIAYHHHERWDGNGYPQGLKGNEIPIEGRLMAIADVYDALISKRVYKDAYSYEDAESLILKESGKAFDPIITEAFKELKYEFREICERFREEGEATNKKDENVSNRSYA